MMFWPGLRQSLTTSTRKKALTPWSACSSRRTRWWSQLYRLKDLSTSHPVKRNFRINSFFCLLSYLRDCWWFLKVVSPCRPQCTLMTYNSHRNAELSTQWSHTMKKNNCQRDSPKSEHYHTWLGSWLNMDIRRLFSVITLCSISRLKLHLLLN